MKLSYYCSSCQKENYIKVKSDNRYDLKQEIGSDHFKERCTHCGNFTKKHINRLRAFPNTKFIYTVLAIAIIITVAMNSYISLTKIVLALPFILWVDQKRKASAFNKLMID